MKKLFVPLLCLLIMSVSCQKKERLYKKSSLAMDTVVSITAVSRSPEEAEKAADAAFGEVRRLERLLSFWTDNSEIALINKNAGKSPVKVSPETLEIIEKSIFISENTGGAFDPTIGPVIRLWDFRNRKKPGKEKLSKALGLVDYRMIRVDRKASKVFLGDDRMSFDTGGIAKGYAADRAVAVLRKMGVRAGLVAVAGDIRAFGKKPDGSPWRVGIRDPRATGEDDALMAYVDLDDAAISTSGDYERYFIEDGVMYHHILNPKTGYPAGECVSVTVMAPEGVYTDGLSTGIFVLGPERGIRLLEGLGFDGIIIDRDFRVHLTRNMKDKIQWLVDPLDSKNN